MTLPLFPPAKALQKKEALRPGTSGPIDIFGAFDFL
jgi:hypothetical protein